MARPPGEGDSVLKYGITYDEYEHCDPGDGQYMAIWLSVHTDGPVVGKEADSWPGQRSQDRLVFENRDLFTPKDFYKVDDDLIAGQCVILPMYDIFFQTEYPPPGHRDQPPHDEFIDLNGETVSVTLSSNPQHQLVVDAQLAVDSWMSYGMDLFHRRCGQPGSVHHWEIRMWNIACLLCPALARVIETEINKHKTEHCHPEMDLLSAPRDIWRLVRPNKSSQREKILKSLCHDNSIYSMIQIGIIIADNDPNITEWITNKDGSVYEAFPPAKDVTVDGLIKAAKLTPVFKKYYSARQITHQLVPVALNRDKAQRRYKTLVDELLDVGVTVPAHPVIHQL